MSVETPVLLDFWAEWCAPCKVMLPLLEEISEGQEETWTLLKVEVDKHPELVEKYQIRGVPTLVMTLRGIEIGRYAGELSITDLEKWITSTLPDQTTSTLLDIIALDDQEERKNELRAFFSNHSPENYPLGTIALVRLLGYSDPDYSLELLQTIPADSRYWQEAQDRIVILQYFLQKLSSKNPILLAFHEAQTTQNYQLMEKVIADLEYDGLSAEDSVFIKAWRRVRKQG